MIHHFDFEEGIILSSKYKVIKRLGSGWEGEVYLVKELVTEIERAAKFFYPARNPKDRTVKAYAKKLYKLRACNSLIKYIAVEKIQINNVQITYLLSDFVEGYSLDTYANSWHPLGMNYYQALHLFYNIVKAVEEIHINKECHGDIHSENVIIQKSGLNYELKLIDVFKTSGGPRGTIQDDVYDLCYLLHEMIGGKAEYKSQPRIIKNICCGLKKTLIRKKFKSATSLRVYLENKAWE